MNRMIYIFALFLLLSLALPFSNAASTPSIATAAATSSSFKSIIGSQIQPAMLASIVSPAVDMGLVAIIVLVVIAIAAMVYILANVINSQNAKNWAKIQIYEALLSVLLIIIFISLFYLFLINPKPAYKSIDLLPSSCDTNSINTLFNLSACDIGTFSNTAMGYFALFSIIGISGGEAPGVEFEYAPIMGLNVKASLESVMPDGMEGMIGTIMSGLLFFLVLNNLQLILVSGSILFLTFFLTLGLVARLFGITRTFGGAMIAFGIGLGIVFPILISLTYGFIDYNAVSSTAALNLLPTVIPDFILFAISGSTATLFLPPTLLLGLGYVVAGLTFIPFINFIILDAFIVDFSKAVGEKMSFMALLSNFI